MFWNSNLYERIKSRYKDEDPIRVAIKKFKSKKKVARFIDDMIESVGKHKYAILMLIKYRLTQTDNPKIMKLWYDSHRDLSVINEEE